MNLLDFPESTWFEWLTEYDANVDASGAPLSVLLTLYPDVYDFGPAASAVEAAFTSVRSFLDDLLPLMASAEESADRNVKNFSFSSFLSLECDGHSLDNEKKFWLEDVSGPSQHLLYNGSSFNTLVANFTRGTSGKFRYVFLYTVRGMLFLYMQSEVCLRMGDVAHSDLSAQTVELRELIESGALTVKLDELRAALSMNPTQHVGVGSKAE